MFPPEIIDEMWEKAVKGLPKARNEPIPVIRTSIGTPHVKRKWRGSDTSLGRLAPMVRSRVHHKGWLPDEVIRAIRHALQEGQTGSKVAKQFNISPDMVSKIKLRQTYQHVQ